MGGGWDLVGKVHVVTQGTCSYEKCLWWRKEGKMRLQSVVKNNVFNFFHSTLLDYQVTN